VGIGVVLAREVMLIVTTKRRQFFQPLHDIGVETALPVVYEDRSRLEPGNRRRCRMRTRRRS
jgi:hypothetical protein